MNADATLPSPAATWLRVLFALMLREVRCRFAGDWLGYAWTFILPLMWTGALLWFFDLIGRHPRIDAPPAAFIATGILPYFVFRQTITSMGAALSRHRNLTMFAAVRMSDILLAAAALEVFNGLLVFALTFTMIALAFEPVRFADPAQVLAGMLTATALGASFGWVSTILGELSVTARRLIPVLLRPLFWVSGIFFIAPEVPPIMRDILWFNPLMHAVERTRSGTFSSYTSSFADPRPPFVFVLAMLILAVLLQSAFRRSKNGLELT